MIVLIALEGVLLIFIKGFLTENVCLCCPMVCPRSCCYRLFERTTRCMWHSNICIGCGFEMLIRNLANAFTALGYGFVVYYHDQIV